MTGNDPRENAPIVKIMDDDGPLVPVIAVENSDDDDGPLFEPNRWYTRKALQQRLGVGNQTWDRWVAAGLKTFQPGTRPQLVYTDEKFDEILRTPAEELPPPYVSPFANKNAARKARKM